MTPLHSVLPHISTRTEREYFPGYHCVLDTSSSSPTCTKDTVIYIQVHSCTYMTKRTEHEYTHTPSHISIRRRVWEDVCCHEGVHSDSCTALPYLIYESYIGIGFVLRTNFVSWLPSCREIMLRGTQLVHTERILNGFNHRANIAMLLLLNRRWNISLPSSELFF